MCSGMCLRVILQVEAMLVNAFGCFAAIRGTTWAVSDVSGAMGGVLGFLGAGVYEELLFRLILLLIVLWTVRCALARTAGRASLSR